MAPRSRSSTTSSIIRGLAGGRDRPRRRGDRGLRDGRRWDRRGAVLSRSSPAHELGVAAVLGGLVAAVRAIAGEAVGLGAETGPAALARSDRIGVGMAASEPRGGPGGGRRAADPLRAILWALSSRSVSSSSSSRRWWSSSWWSGRSWRVGPPRCVSGGPRAAAGRARRRAAAAEPAVLLKGERVEARGGRHCPASGTARRWS
jgi:hypothetical protein